MSRQPFGLATLGLDIKLPRGYLQIRVGSSEKKAFHYIVRYFLPVAHSSCILIAIVTTSLSQDPTLGKSLATFVLRFSSWLILSTTFTVRIFLQCSFGKSKNVRPSTKFSSSQSQNLEALDLNASTTRRRRACASFLSTA